MKNFIKILISFVALGLMAAGFAVSAQTVTEINGSTSIPTLQTQTEASSSNWRNSSTVRAGDKVSFQLHYFIGENPSADNVTFSLENLSGREYSAGDSERVSGGITASNLGNSNGSVTLNFADDVRLNFFAVSWQEFPECQRPSCETRLPQAASNILQSGLNVGTIRGGASNNYAGNMIIEFLATEVQSQPEPPVTFDDCRLDGVTIRHGESARFFSERSTSQTCSAFDLVRTCNDGRLSGSDSFRFATCRVIDNPVFVAPIVDTRSESNVREDSATLNGEVDFSSSVTSGEVFFVFGTSSSNLNRSTSRIFRNVDSSFNTNIDGLQEDTTYFYRAVLVGDDGVEYQGGLESFRTDRDDDDNNNNNDDVEVQTNSASSIDEDSARLNGELEEGDNVEVWFAFDEDDSTPSCSDSRQRIDVNGSFDEGDRFSRTVSGLDEDEEHYFRACAEDNNGDIVSGDIRRFTTDDDDDDNRRSNNNDDAEVTTESASNVDDDSARLNGELEEGDNAEVWFAFSSTDRTPSCLINSQRVDVNGIFDEGDRFSRTVTGLTRNTIYYYRACALGDNGDVETGSIREFVTDEEDDNGDNGGGFFPQFPQTPVDPQPPVFNPRPSVDASTITRLPAGVTQNSATLRSFVTGEGNGTCFFEYGRSTNFGLTSQGDPVNLNTTGECTAPLFGLAPNTTYFYRSVLVDERGNTERGVTRSFRTSSNPTPVVTPRVPSTPLPPFTPRTPVRPATPTPVDTTVRVTVVEEVEQVTTGTRGLELTKFVSSFDDPRFTDRTDAGQNEAVFYKVIVRNNTTDVIEDLTVVDFIPFSLELDGQQSLDDDSDKEVRWRIGRLQPGDSREFTTEMRVRDDVRVGSVIDSFATAFNDDISVNSNQVFIQVDEEEPVNISDNNGSQAASIFGAGFLPTTLAGWLVLVGIVLAIAYLVSRILFSRNENERVLAELRAMQNNQ